VVSLETTRSIRCTDMRMYRIIHGARLRVLLRVLGPRKYLYSLVWNHFFLKKKVFTCIYPLHSKTKKKKRTPRRR
jgi:hypothetical protein